MALQNDIDSGVMNLKDKLFIELKPDMRHGSVRYGGQIFPARVCQRHCYKLKSLGMCSLFTPFYIPATGRPRPGSRGWEMRTLSRQTS